MSGELQPAPGGQAIAPPQNFMQQLGDRMDRIQQFQHEIQRRINPERDLTMFGGKARRRYSFARHIFVVCGGEWEYLKDTRGEPLVIKRTYQDGEGDYYVYEAYGKYTHPWLGVTESTGSCSSRDPFFGITDEEFKPTADVREDHVRQKALTECFKKALFTAFGLAPDLTQEEVDALGLDTSKSGGYDHGAAAGRKSSKAADTGDAAKHRAEIETLCKELYESGAKSKVTGKPFPDAVQVLKEATTSENFDGWKSFAKISSRGLGITLKNVRDLHKELVGEQPTE